MGRKGIKGTHATSGPQILLREGSSGKKQCNVNAKSMCKLDHIRNIAVWAATETSIPPLAAFFGQRLAATAEALGLRADPSLFLCQRCESVLQPGHNCTIRIEKNKSKSRRRRKKSTSFVQNNVIYTCHFCSHRNLLRGTPNEYVKQICSSELLKSDRAKSVTEKNSSLAKLSSIPEFIKLNFIPSPIEPRQNLEASSPATPLPATVLSLSDSKRRKRNRSGPNKAVQTENTSTADAEKLNASSKRRKSWTSLKEIAQKNNRDSGKKISNLTIPFVI